MAGFAASGFPLECGGIRQYQPEYVGAGKLRRHFGFRAAERAAAAGAGRRGEQHESESAVVIVNETETPIRGLDDNAGDECGDGGAVLCAAAARELGAESTGGQAAEAGKTAAETRTKAATAPPAK